MFIRDVGSRSGIIVETLTSFNNVPTGNVYKISGWNADKTKVIAWKQYRQGKIELHPSVLCRILDDRPFSGNYGPF